MGTSALQIMEEGSGEVGGQWQKLPYNGFLFNFRVGCPKHQVYLSCSHKYPPKSLNQQHYAHSFIMFVSFFLLTLSPER